MEPSDFERWMAVSEKEVVQAWERSRHSLPWDDMTRPEVGVGSVTGEDLGDMDRDQIRLACLEALLNFLWAEGPHPIKALKRMYHITLNISPQHLFLMNQTALGKLLNETRAAFSARDMRVWESFLEERGFFGSRAHGKKSDVARSRYAEEKKGNNCRRGGKRAARRITAVRKNQQASS